MPINKLKTYGSTLDSIFENETELRSNDFSLTILPIAHIKPREEQPRKYFDKEKHKELVASIKEKGIIQPIVVRMLGARSYEIIVGERRWRAAQEASLTHIPVVIKDYSTEDVMIVALMENIHRQDLNPLEEAYAIDSLISEFSLTQEQVADKIGKARTTVTNLLRLLNLNKEVKSLLEDGSLEMGHARALLGVDDELQNEIASIIVTKKLTVRQAEKLIQKLKEEGDIESVSLPSIIDVDKLRTWKLALSKKFHSSVNVQVTNAGKGRVVIQFDDVDALNHFVEKVKFES